MFQKNKLLKQNQRNKKKQYQTGPKFLFGEFQVQSTMRLHVQLSIPNLPTKKTKAWRDNKLKFENTRKSSDLMYTVGDMGG